MLLLRTARSSIGRTFWRMASHAEQRLLSTAPLPATPNRPLQSTPPHLRQPDLVLDATRALLLHPWNLQRSCQFATNRQRMKTPSCLKRRFKMTGTGKFMRFGAFHSHNLSKKSKRQRKYGKKKHLVPKSFAKILKRLNFKRR